MTGSLLSPDDISIKPCLEVRDSIENPGAGQAVADVRGPEAPSTPVVEGPRCDADHVGGGGRIHGERRGG